MLAGSLNYDGAVVCRAQSLGEETVLAQIARMVDQAQKSPCRAHGQRLANAGERDSVRARARQAVVTFAVWLAAAHSLPLACWPIRWPCW